MKTDSIVYVAAGSFVLLSVALAHWVDARWIFLAVFVGLNLFQAGLTGFCPLERILLRLGVPKKRQCMLATGKETSWRS